MRPSRAATLGANHLMLLEPLSHRPVPIAAPQSQPPAELASRRIEFHGRAVTAVRFRARWAWRAAEVGLAIGYDEGRILVDKIRADWRDDFRDDQDFALLRGEALREFKRLSSDSLESGADRSPALLVLYESGIDRALILARTPLGRELRDLLVDHVLPQLRATGTATLPGVPAPGLGADDVRRIIREELGGATATSAGRGLSFAEALTPTQRAALLRRSMRETASRFAAVDPTGRSARSWRAFMETKVRTAAKFPAGSGCTFEHMTAEQWLLATLALVAETATVGRLEPPPKAAESAQLALPVPGR